MGKYETSLSVCTSTVDLHALGNYSFEILEPFMLLQFQSIENMMSKYSRGLVKYVNATAVKQLLMLVELIL